MSGTSDLTWFKSSYSGTQGDNCVEVASNHAEAIHVRDSKDTSVPYLSLSPAAWTAFVSHTGCR